MTINSTPFPDQDPDVRKQAYVLWFSIVAWLLPSLISGIFYYKVCSTVWKSRFWGNPDEDNLKTAKTPTAAEENSALTATRAMRWERGDGELLPIRKKNSAAN